jgi:hypothetical protein
VCTTNTTTTYKTNRNETSKLLTETDGKRTAKNGKRTAHGWRTDRPTNGVKRNHFHNFIAGRTRNEKNSFVLGNGCKQSISIVKETNIVNRRHETRGQSDQANTTETAKEDDQNNEQQTKRRQQLHSVTKIQQTNQIATKRQTTKRKIKENNETPLDQTTWDTANVQHHHS